MGVGGEEEKNYQLHVRLDINLLLGTCASNVWVFLLASNASNCVFASTKE